MSRHKLITPRNEKRVRAWIAADLFTMGLDTCRPISRERLTRSLRVRGTPTVPIPVYAQETDRIPLEV